ncbi:MAG: HAMP domain-containing histidine kinase, partial [Oscillospiraceae bacterium]|nr:HAMP domain-containing histidine kinase [Oscillospiraceae bacterium]
KISGVDVLICSQSGRIILCSDSPTGCIHQSYSLSTSYMERIRQSGHLSNVSVLQNVYEDARYISARPVYSAIDNVVGYVIVSTPISEASRLATQVSNFFLIGIAVVTLLTAIMMAYVASRQSTPLREMAKTARAFGHGDLDARVRLSGQHPAEIEELALAFNNMASSLQKSEYSRQEFVANISHELKTPMTTIGGYIDGMRDGTIPPERHPYYMGIVSEETKRLSRLVRSMLDISQLQTEGGIPLEKMSRFEVAECAGQMLITYEQKIVSKNINVDVDFPDYPVYALANRDYISQVIYNLLDNAVKFCPEGGNLRLRLRESDNKLLLSVANDGQTIPAEELSLLFDRFHKIDKSRSQNRDGWGLGLYIVKTIIGLHGEDISVTSMEGVTEFTFTLTPVE